MKYLTKIEQIEKLSPEEKTQLKKITDKFAFRSNKYYLSLIDWEDPDDPLRRLIIPQTNELEKWGRLDPSDEKSYSILPGLEHKYNSTVLMLVSCICEGICRYCFRKRIFIEREQDYLRNLPQAINYIQKHTEVTNVLLTGGDPLVLTTSKLEKIIKELAAIEHVRIIRIGTKIPAFNPYRILEDKSFLEMIKTYSNDQKKIYIMSHFIHPKEITKQAERAVELMEKAGAIICNQMPLIKGINDNPDVLSELLAKLSFIGAVPYYIFQCRPALGNKPYTVPIEQGYEIVEQAKAKVSGLAKRLRYVMSHSTGKIEVIGRNDSHIYLKYHRAADDSQSGKFMILRRNPNAYWFDDYEEIAETYPVAQPYRYYGPE